MHRGIIILRDEQTFRRPNIYLYIYIFNPVSRDFVLMRTNVINLLNRVPDYDCPTFLVLHRTKCILIHSVLTCSTKRNEREKERRGGTERESEKERSFRRGERR